MMNAVRYYSRSGNTKAVAEAIAAEAGVKAVSVDAEEAPVQEETGLLFLGGALYAYGLDRHLRHYIRELDASHIKKAVLFSTASLSRHALDLMRKYLEEQGIAVDPHTYYVKGRKAAASADEAKAFARERLNEEMK